MALGFPPSYYRIIETGSYSKEAFIAIAAEAINDSYWWITSINDTEITAKVKRSFYSWGEDIRIQIKGAKAILTSECFGIQFIDFGKNQKNITKLLFSINAVKEKYSPTELMEKYQELENDFVSNDRLVEMEAFQVNLKNVFSFIIPRKGYLVTPILIGINIALFILMVIRGVNPFFTHPQALLQWGANYKLFITGGEWWRLLASCFIHANIYHLLMNMGALAFVGFLLEPYLGSTKFLTAYLYCGLFASLTSIYWHPTHISVGASGAIFGMCALLLVLLTTKIIPRTTRNVLFLTIIIFTGLNLLAGMLRPHIDNAAHIGGFLAGLVTGLVWLPGIKTRGPLLKKYKVINLFILLFLSISFFYNHNTFNTLLQNKSRVKATHIAQTGKLKTVTPDFYAAIPVTFPKYKEGIRRFGVLESMALEVYTFSPTTPKKQLLYEIRGRGIYYWNENIILIQQLDTLELPENFHEQNKKLVAYCQLRIKDYQLLYRSIKEETDQYNDSLLFYKEKIGRLIEVFNP